MKKGDGTFSCCKHEAAEQILHIRIFTVVFNLPTVLWDLPFYFCVYFKIINYLRNSLLLGLKEPIINQINQIWSFDAGKYFINT
eukprot:bmy_05668T0